MVYFSGQQDQSKGHLRISINAHQVGDRGIIRLRLPTEVDAILKDPRGRGPGGLFRQDYASEIVIREGGGQ